MLDISHPTEPVSTTFYTLTVLFFVVYCAGLWLLLRWQRAKDKKESIQRQAKWEEESRQRKEKWEEESRQRKAELEAESRQRKAELAAEESRRFRERLGLKY